MPKWAVLCLALLVCCAEAESAITKLEVRPGTGNAAVVRFAVDAPTDVTVRIVDRDGKVVRHLAAGMVGLEKAAKPLVGGKLSQTLTWDGTDDAGRKVDPAGCKVSVAVGMRVRFDRFILGNSDAFVLQTREARDVIFRGLNDAYYVAQSFGIHVDTLRVFSKDGKFIRGLFPYHLGRPGAKQFLDAVSPEFGRRTGPVRHDAVDWDGDRVPVSVAHANHYYLTPRVNQAVMTTDGCIVATVGYGAGFAALNVWNREGFCVRHFEALPWHPGRIVPKGTPPETTKRWRNKDLWKLVAGRDGDVYIADGIHNLVAHYRAKDLTPIHFTGIKAKRHYLGEINTPGDDENHFKGPHGIALDEAGNILVLDGDVVKTFSPDGTALGKKPRAETPFDRVRVPIRDGGLTWGTIQKMEQAKPGSSGVPAAVLAAGKRPKTLSFPQFIKIDSTGRLYLLQREGTPFVVSDINGKTLTPRKTAGPGLGYMCTDAADNWYVSVQPGYSTLAELWKFSRDGKRLKFGDADAIIPEDVGKRGNIKGVTVTRSGDIYIVAAYRDFPKAVKRGKKPWSKGAAYLLSRVDVYSPDGTLKKKGLVRSQALSDVLVDREGNIYVIEGKLRYKSRPRRTWPPPFLSKAAAKKYEGQEHVNQRKALMQRLVCFSPEGGVLDGDGGPPQLWHHPGVSGVSPLEGWGHLQPAHMCLDPDQRIWIPDTYNYSVKAVDRAGNLMLRVGKYGNEECRGGGGDKKLEGANIVVDPEIPLARPHGLAVYGDFLFIVDMMSHRVVRCRVAYADRKEIAIRF